MRTGWRVRVVVLGLAMTLGVYMVLVSPKSDPTLLEAPRGKQKIFYIDPDLIAKDIKEAVVNDAQQPREAVENAVQQPPAAVENAVQQPPAAVENAVQQPPAGDEAAPPPVERSDSAPKVELHFDLRADAGNRPELIANNRHDINLEVSEELRAVHQQMPIRRLSNATKVLMLTYYRGGSTFLGEIFNRNSDAFYWFEPLGGLLDKAYNRSAERLTKYRMVEDAVSLTADGKSVEPFPEDFAEVLARSVVKILNCDFRGLPADILKHYFITSWGTSQNFGPYKKCVRDLAGNSANGDIPNDVIDTCVPEIYPPCLASPIRSLKTIRMTAREMTRVLELDPSIQIIYYVRDPRGLLNSRWSIFGRKNEDDVIKQLCGKLRDDISCANRLLETKPDHFRQLRYEDFATDPVGFATKVYDIIGHELPPNVKKYVMDNTHSESENDVMGTRRKNSTDNAVKWQRQIPENVLRKFNTNCKDIFEAFGYPIN